MDFGILIKILLVVYIISSPVVGSIPIQHYVSHSSFVCIYIVCCLIIGIVYDIIICLLLIAILFIWMYTKPPAVKKTPIHLVKHERGLEPSIDKVSIVDSESSVDSESAGSADSCPDTFEGYDNNKDSFACFESF